MVNWVELKLTKWNWPSVCFSDSINSAFMLNNSYTWLVSWENSQACILSQDPHGTLWFGLLMSDVSNGLIQLYMYERCKSLLWLLNQIYLQIISVITELEKNIRETNIKYYFIFMFVIYKYTNSDIIIIHN